MDDSTPKIIPNFQTQPRRILVFIIEWMIVNLIALDEIDVNQLSYKTLDIQCISFKKRLLKIFNGLKF